MRTATIPKSSAAIVATGEHGQELPVVRGVIVPKGESADTARLDDMWRELRQAAMSFEVNILNREAGGAA